ncbi:hypothetical protein GCM10023193_22250 [Planotetraspora kaengkrachanensis]|uniref:Uncharacterized protein n=1 Tax=Planotetraspora kaengkrachanensis TaxID=575193 RepID=A0A8J3LVW0_9ACTN|nr:hypothetical protein Pka01_31900 [Planotetraspora kaengkrachanensis]
MRSRQPSPRRGAHLKPKRRGAQPTPLPGRYEQLLTEYTAALQQVPLAAAPTPPACGCTWPG